MNDNRYFELVLASMHVSLILTFQSDARKSVVGYLASESVVCGNRKPIEGSSGGDKWVPTVLFVQDPDYNFIAP